MRTKKQSAGKTRQAPEPIAASTAVTGENEGQSNDYFTPKELDKISKTLVDMKKTIFRGIDEGIKQGSSKDTSEYQGDNYDIAASERDRELTYMLGDRERIKIREIDNALLKIKDGSYGICEECGEPIAKKRLMLIPYTNLCINCQSHAEEEERIRTKDGYPESMDHLTMIDEDDSFKDQND